MCPIIIQYIFYHHQNTVLINVHSLLFLGNIDHLYNKTGVLEVPPSYPEKECEEVCLPNQIIAYGLVCCVTAAV